MASRTMFLIQLYLFSLILHSSFCDWASEWMAPVRDHLTNKYSPPNGPQPRGVPGVNYDAGIFDEETERVTNIYEPESLNMEASQPNYDISAASLKSKLENSLQTAKLLTETLKMQINALTLKEVELKEAIANGRSGVTALTVSSMGRLPRTYLIRDGYWTRCNGMVQPPPSDQTKSFFNEINIAPRCIGQEVSSGPDPCVFNSITKYETIPTYRRLEYYEEDYLCLKPTFNSSMEQYLSVPKQLVNETCSNGVIRTLTENSIECGIRTLADYTYYPQRSYTSLLPLEYCTEKDGSCRLIVAWHISNTTIENFEFLKNQPNFKKYFIRANFVEQVI
ncbi:uncharacterized protein LOC128679163 [Plodia interpunctella]|uniref:uncharacterized protein LOC128679163 n=1 Tax=Plodia interpunctella TaxID=58824 RepID=UPI00236899DB|nr:uncharacterized protein LOC128679163 [Plodia interpunctella]